MAVAERERESGDPIQTRSTRKRIIALSPIRHESIHNGNMACIGSTAMLGRTYDLNHSMCDVRYMHVFRFQCAKLATYIWDTIRVSGCGNRDVWV